MIDLSNSAPTLNLRDPATLEAFIAARHSRALCYGAHPAEMDRAMRRVRLLARMRRQDIDTTIAQIKRHGMKD
jgi:hypothetical protein